MSGYYGMELPQVCTLTSEQVLKLAEEIAKRLNRQRTLNLKEAAAAYGLDARTISKHVETGAIKGVKQGGVWQIETPQARFERLNNNKE